MAKLVFISNMATPYQVKFCYELQKYFDTEFWFYEYIGKGRPDWWKIPLGSRCKILKHVIFSYRGKYLSLSVVSELSRMQPDVVMLGGWSIPGNMLAYFWAKFHRKKTILFSEHLRTQKGIEKKKTLMIKFLCLLYNRVDAVFTVGKHGKKQFIESFGFSAEKVFEIYYPNDLGELLKHPLRRRKQSYTYLFSHRLIDIYNPIMAIEIFSEIKKRYPGSKLRMNANGPLRRKCEEKIQDLDLQNDVMFLDNISSWDELHNVYRSSDISISPCIYSNGNMSIREAMASGMGVVVSDRVKVNSEEILRNKSGFVCKLSKQTFVAAIEKYIKKPALFEEYGLINKRFTRAYSIENRAKMFAELINDKVLKPLLKRTHAF